VTPSPFSNPFGGTTGSVPQASTQNDVIAPQSSQGGYASVQSQPLSAPQATPLSAPQVISAPSGASHLPATPLKSASMGKAGASGWNATDGVPVTLGQGETLSTLSNRYGVPVASLMSANGLTSINQAKPGQQIIIPLHNTSGTKTVATPAPVTPLQTAAQKKALEQATRERISAEKAAAKLAQEQGARERQAAAQSTRNQVSNIVTPKVDQKPAQDKLAQEKLAKEKLALEKAAKDKLLAEKKAAEQVAKTKLAEQQAQKKAAQAAPEAKQQADKAQTAKATEKVSDPETTASIAKESHDFRWPARGRVISGFTGKGGNEGISIALPEGTPVKAAEGGVVAYSGSELKGYGNLILVRHDNGFVSAYANNGELLVKRGEKVKRGQLIAKSGQTGNVSSPQLHFELRKGATPVDPLQHLSGM
jgi:murein DD-endopeptidase MepM/ murein hydrolase activator NlpD